jgi:hypothetical protein
MLTPKSPWLKAVPVGGCSLPAADDPMPGAETGTSRLTAGTADPIQVRMN